MRPGQPHEQANSVSAVVCVILTTQQLLPTTHGQSLHLQGCIDNVLHQPRDVRIWAHPNLRRKPLHIPPSLHGAGRPAHAATFLLLLPLLLLLFCCPNPRVVIDLKSLRLHHRLRNVAKRFSQLLGSYSLRLPFRPGSPQLLFPSSPLLLSCCCELCGQRRRPLYRDFLCGL